VGPRAVLVAVVKRKIPSPRRESNPIFLGLNVLLYLVHFRHFEVNVRSNETSVTCMIPEAG
jgi:hypothetical protein